MSAGNGFTGRSPLFQSCREIPLRISGVTRFHAAAESLRVTAVRTKATSVWFTPRRSAGVTRTCFAGALFVWAGSVPVGASWLLGPLFAKTIAADANPVE